MKKWKIKGCNIRWQEETQVRLIFWWMVCVLVAILIPLLGVAHYNFKSVDDFSFAQNAELVWESTHSVFKVIAAQISYTWQCYLTWQGTFFSEWLTTSLMGIFSKNAYYMATYLSLGGFVLAEMILLMTVFCKVLGADRYRAGIVSISCVSMQVLLTPIPCEAFFWFCSAMVYTFIHALALLLCTLLIMLYQECGKKRIKKVLLLTGTLFLTVAVAGSNYITGLTMLLCYVMFAAGFWWKKHPRRKLITVYAILYLAAFLINILAPGNQARQNASGVESLSAFHSILLSLKEAATYVATWTIFPCVVLGIMLIPIFLSMVRKKAYRYPLPVLVSLLSFGVFAAQFTPTIYALGIIGAGRVQNLYRFNLFLLLYGNELYWTGWCWRKWKEAGWRKADSEQESSEQNGRSLLLPGWLAGGLILIFGLHIWGGSTLTSVSAYHSLRNGDARRYYEEYQERLVLLEQEDVSEVYLEPFSVKPYVLFFGDVAEDTEDWVNKSVAEYFHKAAVGLKERAEE